MGYIIFLQNNSSRQIFVNIIRKRNIILIKTHTTLKNFFRLLNFFKKKNFNLFYLKILYSLFGKPCICEQAENYS